jgi:hypothetical protein
MTNIMNGATQLSLDGKIIVLGLAAMVLVFEAAGDGLVELEAGGFDVLACARLFHVTLYLLK